MFLYELTEMSITRKSLSICQCEHLVSEIINYIITLGIEIVPRHQHLENVSVTLETLYFVYDDQL